MEEFSRNRNFKRVFPLENNVEYYSRFISEPSDENILLWTWYKNKYNNSGYENLLFENGIN